MNKRPDPEQDLDRLLDADGGEFGAIYRRLSRPEPPRRLDRVVIANAARAVHGGRAPRAQRWLLGMGSAAGIVLAAGIAWQVGQQIDSQEAKTRQNEGARSVIPVVPITETARMQKSVPAQAEAAIQDKEMADAVTETKQEPVMQTRRKVASPPPAPAIAPPPPPPVETRMSAPEPSPAPFMDNEAEAFPAAKDSALAQPPAAAGGTLKRDQSVERATGNASMMAAPKPAAEQARVPSPNSSVKLRQNMHLPAQDWLAEIVRLKREGRRQEAIENLRLFRRMHPDWKLSDELRKLAE
jgi:hypothetical protein